jgi:CRISPR-associated endonuclease/helicase Cas3
MQEILLDLPLDESLVRCLTTAARFHDQGKKRAMFQAMLGNRRSPDIWWAKSGPATGLPLEEKYRHEFGSLHDLPPAEALQLTAEQHQLVLHLIAAHHGRARPHFPADEVFDPSASVAADTLMAQAVPQRFGRLQRRFGRWGLAYLESLLRAADWSASANPSAEVEDSQ